MKKIIVIILMSLVGYPMIAQTGSKTRNIILITLDGFRWQEVFNGADSVLFHNKEFTENREQIEGMYWRDNALERRKELMPFLWDVVAVQGQIYGNRPAGCLVNVKNPYWFSYPGYNELLTGFADEKINSNEYGPNPNINVLEFITARSAQFKDKIAVFSSWNAFSDIVNEKRSHILVNSGLEKLTEKVLSPELQILNKIQDELPDLFNGVRLDAVTFNIGFNYLKTNKPRILYLAFDETDDFAHNGRYDLYLNAAHYEDGFLKELWQWVQSDPGYKDKTTLFITCDHGRGTGANWKDHGSEVAGSGETWFAVMGPDTPALGETMDGQYFNNQFASTLAALIGYKYESQSPVGEPIGWIIRKTVR